MPRNKDGSWSTDPLAWYLYHKKKGTLKSQKKKARKKKK